MKTGCGVQGGCVRIIKVFEKNHFFIIFFCGGGVFGLGVFGLRGQGGCERRIEVFVKIQKYIIFFFLGGGVGGGIGSDGGRVGGSGWM